MNRSNHIHPICLRIYIYLFNTKCVQPQLWFVKQKYYPLYVSRYQVNRRIDFEKKVPHNFSLKTASMNLYTNYGRMKKEGFRYITVPLGLQYLAYYFGLYAFVCLSGNPYVVRKRLYPDASKCPVYCHHNHQLYMNCISTPIIYEIAIRPLYN